jgi:hypothetical protein
MVMMLDATTAMLVRFVFLLLILLKKMGSKMNLLFIVPSIRNERLLKSTDYLFTENVYLFNVIVYTPEVNTIYTCFEKSLYLFITLIYRSKEKQIL